MHRLLGALHRCSQEVAAEKMGAAEWASCDWGPVGEYLGQPSQNDQ